MDLTAMVVIGLLVAVIPLALFLSLVALAILIWSWKRIGTYFVSFGRWVGDWRNFVPLGCLGALALIVIVLAAAILPDQLSIVRTALLWLVIVAGVIFLLFALILWSVRLGAWLWPRFRREFWGILQSGWDLVGRGMSGERRGRRRTPGETRPPRRLAAEKGQQVESSGTPEIGARRVARAGPPRRRSFLDLSWLWSLVWGKPQKPARRPKPVGADASADIQTQTSAVSHAAMPPDVPAKPKAGLQPLMWRLGLLGRPRSVRRPKPGATPGMTDVPAKPAPPPAAAPGQPRPVVAAPAPRPAEVKPKPTAVVRAKPKRGVFGAVGAVGRSIAGALEGVRKAFWVGVFLVGRKAKAGLNAVLRLLHLGGKRR